MREHVVVTGASTGIGRATADHRALAHRVPDRVFDALIARALSS